MYVLQISMCIHFFSSHLAFGRVLLDHSFPLDFLLDVRSVDLLVDKRHPLIGT